MTHASPSHLDKSHELFKALAATELECEALSLPLQHVAAAADAVAKVDSSAKAAKARTAKAGAAKAGAAKAGAAKANGKAVALRRKK